LRLGKQAQNSLRHQVRAGMAQQMKAILARRGEDFHPRASGQRSRQVAEHAIHPNGDSLLGQPRTDCGRKVRSRGTRAELFRGTIGQHYGNPRSYGFVRHRSEPFLSLDEDRRIHRAEPAHRAEVIGFRTAEL
jgi:hypothetical protein